MRKKLKNTELEKKLKKLRSEVNDQDRLLLKVLKKRFSIVKKIAALKEKNKMPVLQKSRFLKIIKDRVLAGKKLKLNSLFVVSLMKLIHNESLLIQQSLINKNKNKNKPEGKK